MRSITTIRSRLRDDTGSALIDAMAGVIVASIAVLGLATVTVNVSNAVSNTANDADRLSYLRSHAHAAALNPDDLPSESSPATKTVPIGGRDVPVTTWTTATTGSTIIHAAAPRWTNVAPGSCDDPAAIELSQCITTTVTVTPNGGGLRTIPAAGTLTAVGYDTSGGALAPAGAIGTFTASPGNTQLRYVLRVGATAGDGQLVITDATGTVLTTASFSTGFDGYLYGSVDHPADAPITISLSGAGATVSDLYVYEAPR